MKVHPSEMAGLVVSRFGEQTGVGPGNSILAVDPGLVMGMGYCNESTHNVWLKLSSVWLGGCRPKPLRVWLGF